MRLLLGMARTNFPFSRLRCAWGTSTLNSAPSDPAAGMRFIVNVYERATSSTAVRQGEKEKGYFGT